MASQKSLKIMADYGSLFVAEELCLDGSIFVEWYLHLREFLHTNTELYVLDEPLEECPNMEECTYNIQVRKGLNKTRLHGKQWNSSSPKTISHY